MLVALLLVGTVTGVWAQDEFDPRVEVGRELIAFLGCPGCHAGVDPSVPGPPSWGPDLRRISSKTRRNWALEWLMAPHERRRATLHPRFFTEADRSEARNIVAYLWEASLPVTYPKPPAGDGAGGETVFESVGCTGCHFRGPGAERGHRPDHRRHGPDLGDLDGKVTAGWLFAWLRNPRQYAPGTRMPDLRLTADEAADLTAFLLEGRALEPGSAEPRPAGGGGDAEAGRAAISEYGCYGCHIIAGFEDAGKFAGSWDSVEGFTGHDTPGLPDFALSSDEAGAIRAAAAAAPDTDGGALIAGRRLVTRFNCRGCHLIEGAGRAIRATIDKEGLLPPDLNGEGSRVQPRWLAAYLHDPGSVRLRSWLSVRMPTFPFNDEQVRTVVAYFRTLEREEMLIAPDSPPTAKSIALGREAFDLMPCSGCHPTDPTIVIPAGLSARFGPPLFLARARLRYGWIESWIREPQRWTPGTAMPSFFLESAPGFYRSPFVGALDSPMLAEPKVRMLKQMSDEEELEAFLNDGEAVIKAIRDYVWSLEERNPAK